MCTARRVRSLLQTHLPCLHGMPCVLHWQCHSTAHGALSQPRCPTAGCTAGWRYRLRVCQMGARVAAVALLLRLTCQAEASKKLRMG